MEQLLATLEAIPDGEVWHVSLGQDEFFLSDFEGVDPSIYGNSNFVLANVIKRISGSSAISKRNKIEFELSHVLFVRSTDGMKTVYSKEHG